MEAPVGGAGRLLGPFWAGWDERESLRLRLLLGRQIEPARDYGYRPALENQGDDDDHEDRVEEAKCNRTRADDRDDGKEDRHGTAQTNPSNVEMLARAEAKGQ